MAEFVSLLQQKRTVKWAVNCLYDWMVQVQGLCFVWDKCDTLFVDVVKAKTPQVRT